MRTKQRTLFWLLMLGSPFVLGFCLLMGASGFGWPGGITETGQALSVLRVNRVFAGFAVGAALSCAGAVFQAILRNPLAEPYILGVSSGAGLGAGLTILISELAAWSSLALPAGSFLCAILTLLIVYGLASEGGTPSVYGLILSGVIVSAVCSSILMFLVSLAPVEGLHSIVWWMLGDLDVSSPYLLRVCIILIAAGFAIVWLLAPELNALTLGTEMAHYVGVRTRIAVMAGLGVATLLAAGAVALSGLIGFVGLIVPHVMRNLFGPDHRRLVPAVAVGGGVFLAACDAVARTVLPAGEIPVGVVTALVGGPFFLAILRKRKRQGWME